MTEFLEWLEINSNVQDDIVDWEVAKKNALEKEKEQICNDYTDGLEGLYIGAEEYYNQIYTKRNNYAKN
jgi:hypothetical protein